MKRLALVLALIVSLPGMSFAAPFLCTDRWVATEVQPDLLVVTVDGVDFDSVPYLLADGSVKLHFDLADFSVGRYSVTVKACNELGCSPVTPPFVYDASVPRTPSGVSVCPD